MTGPAVFVNRRRPNAGGGHTLNNGLKIIIMERYDAPIASFITSVDVGGANDPKEYTGLAHMFEHMASKDITDLEVELAAMKVEDSIWADLRLERKKGQLASKSYWGESPFGEGNITEMYVERAL